MYVRTSSSSQTVMTIRVVKILCVIKKGALLKCKMCLSHAKKLEKNHKKMATNFVRERKVRWTRLSVGLLFNLVIPGPPPPLAARRPWSQGCWADAPCRRRPWGGGAAPRPPLQWKHKQCFKKWGSPGVRQHGGGLGNRAGGGGLVRIGSECVWVGNDLSVRIRVRVRMRVGFRSVGARGTPVARGMAR